MNTRDGEGGAAMEYAICAFESEDLGVLLRQLRLFAEQVAP